MKPTNNEIVSLLMKASGKVSDYNLADELRAMADRLILTEAPWIKDQNDDFSKSALAQIEFNKHNKK